MAEHDEEKDPLAAEELEPGDDAIIGRAFWWSLTIILLLGGLIAGALYLLKRPVQTPVSEKKELVLPEVQRKAYVVPALPFSDITASAGIDFVHENGAHGLKLLPETMGAGCAFFDYDGDGFDDLFLVNGTKWPDQPRAENPATLALYRNDGSGKFRDVTAEAGMDHELYGMGVAVGDVDGDGDADVFVTAVGENRLFANNDGRFEDITARAGVAGDPRAWSTGCGFFDYDNDGDLDLFVCNYVRWSKEIDLANDFQLVGVGRAYGPPTNFEGTHSYLYRNDGGSFTDVSLSAGIQVRNPATGKPMGKSLAIAPVDYDGDGWIDLIVANDTVQNFTFHNQGDGTFQEVGAAVGLAFDRNGNATGAMGIDTAYYRNDDLLGVAIGNFANEMTSLYVSQDIAGQFADEAIGEGIGPKSRLVLTFGLLFFDADLDGRLDMVQANGHLEEEINQVQVSQHYRQPAQLFWNTGEGRGFELAAEVGELGKPIVGRGIACSDIDADGDLDLLLTRVGGPPLLLRNDQTLHHHWIAFIPRNRAPATARGAIIEIVVGGNKRKQHLVPTRGYLSHSTGLVTFGLGEEAEIESARIIWPDGESQDLGRPAVDQRHEIIRP